MVSVSTCEKSIQPFFKGLELVLSQEAVQVDGHVTVVCEEELEGSAMVTTMEELFSPTFPAGSTVSKTFKWLLVSLPSLPHFDAVRATCCFALRQVSLYCRVATGQEMVREKQILQGQGKVREFYFEAGKLTF